ncbi:hypothetical protein BHM03_00050013 [Ensete ventricosum]|nr:hypothetical protein BHM03_00050013 [Ensete ventricosum]
MNAEIIDGYLVSYDEQEYRLQLLQRVSCAAVVAGEASLPSIDLDKPTLQNRAPVLPQEESRYVRKEQNSLHLVASVDGVRA